MLRACDAGRHDVMRKPVPRFLLSDDPMPLFPLGHLSLDFSGILEGMERVAARLR